MTTDFRIFIKPKRNSGASLAVKGLRFCAATAGSAGVIPGQGTKIPHAEWCSKKKKSQIRTPEPLSHQP